MLSLVGSRYSHPCVKLITTFFLELHSTWNFIYVLDIYFKIFFIFKKVHRVTYDIIHLGIH